MGADIQYLTNAEGQRTAVIISIDDWEDISKYLNERGVLNEIGEDIRAAMKEVRAMKTGEVKETELSDFLNDL